MSELCSEDEYLIRTVPAKLTDSNRDSIYLFRSTDIKVGKTYTTRGAVFRKLKPVLDLMAPRPTPLPVYDGIKDYVITKDEFEAITGKRP